MNADDNIAPGNPEGPGGFPVVHLGNFLDFQVVVTGAERPHFIALPFFGMVGDFGGQGICHAAVFLDALEVLRRSVT